MPSLPTPSTRPSSSVAECDPRIPRCQASIRRRSGVDRASTCRAPTKHGKQKSRRHPTRLQMSSSFMYRRQVNMCRSTLRRRPRYQASSGDMSGDFPSFGHSPTVRRYAVTTHPPRLDSDSTVRFTRRHSRSLKVTHGFQDVRRRSGVDLSGTHLGKKKSRQHPTRLPMSSSTVRPVRPFETIPHLNSVGRAFVSREVG